MINFVTFCAQSQAVDSDNGISWNGIATSTYQMLDLMFRSADIFHQNCKKVILTDPNTDFCQLDPGVQICRSTVDPQAPLMYKRLTMEIDYLKQCEPHENVIFLDLDILVNADLSHLFSDSFLEEFDLGLTYRDDDDMPINWGIMFVPSRNRHVAIRFLEKVQAYYKATYFSKSIFWGNQYSLIETIGRAAFAERDADSMDIEGAKILFLAGTIYNFSPTAKTSDILYPFKQEKVIHFKGIRKRLMPLYWEAHLACYEKVSWRSRIQADVAWATLVAKIFKEAVYRQIYRFFQVLIAQRVPSHPLS